MLGRAVCPVSALVNQDLEPILGLYDENEKYAFRNLIFDGFFMFPLRIHFLLVKPDFSIKFMKVLSSERKLKKRPKMTILDQ